jgi:D-xylose transport system permease protein
MNRLMRMLPKAEPDPTGNGNRDTASLADPGGPATLAGAARRALLTEDMRVVPVVAGWVILGVLFQTATGLFFTTHNLSDLVVQSTVTGLIALGMILVLLVGEIDLSVAANSGFCAALMGNLLVVHHVNEGLAIAAAIVTGALIGAIQGKWCNLFGLPSFVVTLGVSLVLNGGQLALLPNQGQISLLGLNVAGLAQYYLPNGWLWAGLAASVAGYLLFRGWQLYRRRAEGLPGSWVRAIAPVGLLAVAGALIVVVFVRSGGAPPAVVIFFGLLAVASYVTRHTKFGQYLYAVGGNREAARRAGVRVGTVRVAAFAAAGALAAFGGIVSAARILGVTGSLGSGSLLLNVIAAAVIGGVSLFGGKGRVGAALLGAVIIQTVADGLNLMNVGPEVVYAATGGLLILAVTIDGLVGKASARRTS